MSALLMASSFVQANSCRRQSTGSFRAGKVFEAQLIILARKLELSRVSQAGCLLMHMFGESYDEEMRQSRNFLYPKTMCNRCVVGWLVVKHEKLLQILQTTSIQKKIMKKLFVIKRKKKKRFRNTKQERSGSL